jgi:hypothetical protein
MKIHSGLIRPKRHLVLLVSPDALGQGVDGLGEDVGWDAAGHQDVAQLVEQPARLDRVLAAHRHLQKNAGSQCCKILQSISWVDIIDRGFGLFISSGIPLE